jgi:hypothetical protein
MKITIIRIYPSFGYGSYKVAIQTPDWVKNLDDFIEAWLTDNIINSDHWEYEVG